MSIRIYYCRDCGNYTFFEFTAKYVYNASLKGLSYLDVKPVLLKVNKVRCKVCGSTNVAYVECKRPEDIPDLIPFLTIKGEKRVKMFEELRKEYGGDIVGEKE